MSDKRATVWVFLPGCRYNSPRSCGGETWGRMEVDVESQERNASRFSSESKLCLLCPGTVSANESLAQRRLVREIKFCWPLKAYGTEIYSCSDISVKFWLQFWHL